MGRRRMKRSKMVSKIKELIEINLQTLNEVPDAELLSELILYMQETSGMLPPHRPELMGNPNIKTDDDCANLPALIIKDVQTWEPE